ASLGVRERVNLLHGDLFQALPAEQRFDLLVANPPYVAAAELPALPPELKHEPALALLAGEAGLDVLVRLCADAPRCMRPRGWLLFVVGAGQALEVIRMLAESAELTNVLAHRDLGEVERVVEAQRSGA